MVKNIGGYTPSFGSSTPHPERPEVPRGRRTHRAAVVPRVAEAALAAEARVAEERRQAVDKAVRAVLERALEDEPLPFDVAQTLLAKEVQKEVMSRVHASVMRMRDSGIDVDVMVVGESLSTLDEAVIERIKE